MIDLEAAGAFLESHARLVERLVFAHRFRDASPEPVLHVLQGYQNEDGGFGESQDSDLQGRFTPSPESAALITAAAYGMLREAKAPGAAEAASRALGFILRSQDEQGGWPEVSLCTQFPGLYASYELMTLVALTTTLFRARRPQA